MRDQVAAEAALADALGIDRWAAVISGSMGGMRALATRFGRKPQGDGRFAVESDLDHHAANLAKRFDPGSYVVLTMAMNTHDGFLLELTQVGTLIAESLS